VCDLETSRMGAPYIYDISHLRVKVFYGIVVHLHNRQTFACILNTKDMNT